MFQHAGKGLMAKPLFYLDVVSFSKYRTKPQVSGKFPEATYSTVFLPALK